MIRHARLLRKDMTELKLGIELDGDIHLEQKEYDQIRDEQLAESGIKIIRFRNEDLNDMKTFKNSILTAYCRE